MSSQFDELMEKLKAIEKAQEEIKAEIKKIAEAAGKKKGFLDLD